MTITLLQLQVLNCGHFLTSFQPTCLHCYFTSLLISDVRMTTFTHQLLSRKNINPRSLIMRVRIFSHSATVSVALLRMGYAEIGGKLDTMWPGAWRRPATRHQGVMWPLQMMKAAAWRTLSQGQKHRNLQCETENLQFTEPNILSTE